jgi:hypothetical protein
MNNTLKTFALFSLTTGCFLITGCDSVRHTLGLDHYQPNEFDVIGKPPLSIPPEYNLRPPRPGEPDRGYVPEKIQMQQKLYGQPLQLNEPQSKAVEQTILSKAAKDANVDPNIRQKVDQEAESEGTVLQRLGNLKNKAVKNLTLSEDADVKTPKPSATSEPEVKE